MSSICEDYVHLSQFYYATTHEYSEDPKAAFKHTIRQIKDINFAIPEGSPVERHKPEYVGFTALHFAVLKNCEEAVKLLLERGADPTLRNRDGYSPLRLAGETSFRSQRRCLDLQGQLKHPILEMLLSAQVKAGNTTNVSCKNGVSHFHLACMMNHEEAVKFFLYVSRVPVNQTVNRDSPILPGYTALHFAVRYGSTTVVSALLDSRADLTIGDIAGITPLQLLVERNLELIDVISTGDEKMWGEFEEDLKANEEILDLLLDWSRLFKTDSLMPELHALCARRAPSHELILRLTERDINAALDVRSPVRPGYTALHIAAHFDVETVKLLLSRGADVAIKDVRGVTPFDICVSHFNSEDVQSVIESVKSLRDISFTDGTELLDVVLMISDPTLIDGKYFRHQVTSDSPLWAGYTMLHLAVEFARRLDSAGDIINKSDRYIPSKLTVRGKVDEASKRVVRACSKFIDISTQNASGMTALHLAFRQHKRDLVNLLLEEIHKKGMKTNPSDFGNLSHLHIMCVEGRTSIVQSYLNSCNSQINLNDAVQTGFQWYTVFPEPGYARPGSTALHLAVIFHKADVARLLLQHGADPLALDADGLTPLQLAFLNGSLNTPMRTVLISGLKATNVNPTSSEGLSLFHVACYTNNESLAEGLLRNGLADLEASIECGLKDTHKDRPKAIKTSQYYTSEYDCSENFLPLAPFSGYRALHMAVQGQALQVVQMLVRYGADKQARNTVGLSSLQLALQYVHRDKRSKEIAIRLLQNSAEYEDLTDLHIACLLKAEAAFEKALEAGVDIDARLDLESPIWPGSTALHLLFEGDIVWNKLEPMLKQLLRRGANVNQPNCENLTPIHLAYNQNCLPAVKMMLRSSRILESNPVDDEGLSHFHIACALAECSLVEEFLVCGLADANLPKDFFTSGDDAGYAPLHFSMFRGNCATVETLLRHEANVLAVNRNGSTILHKAARQMDSSDRPIHEKIVLRCINANANVNAMDIFGITPLELCLQNNASYLIPLFLERGARINLVNPISDKGLLSYADGSNLQFILDNASDIASIDPDTGFNAIHNIVSSHSFNTDYFILGRVIEQLMDKGCDLDQPDAKGRTPLHVAMRWKESYMTVQVLLDLGADINVVDKAGNTPLIYCKSFNKTHGLVLSHLSKLDDFGLFVNAVNKNHRSELSKMHENTEELRHQELINSRVENCYDKELENIREVIIFEGFSLADLLKETAVTAYPSLARSKREAIANSVGFDKLLRWPILMSLLNLQHRRALARIPLFESAKASLQLCARRALSDFRLPDLCSDMIVRFLTNEDLLSLSNIIE
ncbi:serine/threonine-protein phosphatase 6 regulatory ankyrin repeat subunit C [Nasonia vitripennis]|uniref:Uncharacterized protein n=1 Tax=Nasonia vitripennis TaxID=7425 RepID=A0A7M7T6K0_NASVI|nr:serine/threonine-protein phosphatase 6 regulatory ankyrin repeat subunit C [Nasonia vitripennis]XP_032452806.1 serine/threonine-protein phosphatase 6 regulatory ankyrin repeat subunit C [Nasonia vitripennis]